MNLVEGMIVRVVSKLGGHLYDVGSDIKIMRSKNTPSWGGSPVWYGEGSPDSVGWFIQENDIYTKFVAGVNCVF